MIDHSDTKMSGHNFCSHSFCYRLKGKRGISDNYLHRSVIGSMTEIGMNNEGKPSP